MKWWHRKEENREADGEVVIDDPILKAILSNDEMDREKVLNIPTIAGGIEKISSLIAGIPIKVYQERDGDTKEIKDDYRLKLLNDETGDLLDSYQAKKSLIRDYILDGNGYFYINKKGNQIQSLHYVEPIHFSVSKNTDPIFKSIDIRVQGKQYREFEFLALTRNTVDGFTGRGIIQENTKALAVAYDSLAYEGTLVKTGGNKRGFIKAKTRLVKEAIDKLKESWRNMYQNNTESVVVLNDGLEFQEASNTSVEMQLNENKKTNAEELCKILGMSKKVLDGTANEEEYNNFIKDCIMPILHAFATALNKSLLLETEKDSGYYFAFDCKELIKGDLKKLFEAYKVAVDSNIMGIDEVRYELDLKPLGFDYIKLGLQDVLLNPKTKEIYTPNMNATARLDNMSQTKGGEEQDESRD